MFKNRVAVIGFMLLVGASFGNLQAAALRVNKLSLSPVCTTGSNAISDSFNVWNGSSDQMNYTITDDADWITCIPDTGNSTGDIDTITVSYYTDELAEGTYTATITLTSAEATNSPKTIDITLTVTNVSNVMVYKYKLKGQKAGSKRWKESGYYIFGIDSEGKYKLATILSTWTGNRKKYIDKTSNTSYKFEEITIGKKTYKQIKEFNTTYAMHLTGAISKMKIAGQEINLAKSLIGTYIKEDSTDLFSGSITLKLDKKSTTAFYDQPFNTTVNYLEYSLRVKGYIYNKGD